MAYSDAQREATERYNRKTYERIELKAIFKKLRRALARASTGLSWTW